MKLHKEYTCPLELKPGFRVNELHHKMDGHILDQYTLKRLYSNEGVHI